MKASGVLSVSQTDSGALKHSSLKRRPVLKRVTPSSCHSAFLGDDTSISLVMHFSARVSTPTSENQAQGKVPNLCYDCVYAFAYARPVYCLPPLHLQTLLTVHPSFSAYRFWYRQGDNSATSKTGGVSGRSDSVSLDLSARPVSLLSVQPCTRQHA